MVALLDVNVLMALLDWNHQSHRMARSWLIRNSSFGWATCPITQNGILRILSNPKYQSAAGYSTTISTGQVALWLAQLVTSPDHLFVSDDISLMNEGVLEESTLLSYRHITDLYLLALAVHHGMKFVTFDTRISITSVSGAKAETLEVIGTTD